MSYHVILYHIISYYIVLYHIISYHILHCVVKIFLICNTTHDMAFYWLCQYRNIKKRHYRIVPNNITSYHIRGQDRTGQDRTGHKVVLCVPRGEQNESADPGPNSIQTRQRRLAQQLTASTVTSSYYCPN